MRTETVTYEADGLKFESELFVEAGTEPRPGVLVFPEAFGLSDHARQRAEGLAKLGYVALACDIHGGGRHFRLIVVLTPWPTPASSNQRAVTVLVWV